MKIVLVKRLQNKITPLSSIVVFSLLMLLIVISVLQVRAQEVNQVALVIQHSDDETITQCIDFTESEISGLDVIDLSGLDYNIEAAAMGATICRLDNEGCSYPQDDCFCQCQGAECVYWSYWHLIDGEWAYSSEGASDYTITNGAVEGWVWGLGNVNEADPPPNITFDEVCNAAQADPTDTATATAAATKTPTNTPAPTATPTETPTNTPTATAAPTQTPTGAATPTPTAAPTGSTTTLTPEATPIINTFTVERTTINAGEDVLLRWNLSAADAAYLRYEGIEQGVTAPGEIVVSPTKTTVYTLVARKGTSEAIKQITITVIEAVANTPQPIDTTLANAPATASPKPALPTPTPTNPPAAETLPTTASLPPTSTPLPSSTATPAPLPTSTFTPQAVVLAPKMATVQPPIKVTAPLPAEIQSDDANPGNRIFLFGAVSGAILLLFLGGVTILAVWGGIWWFVLRKP